MIVRLQCNCSISDRFTLVMDFVKAFLFAMKIILLCLLVCVSNVLDTFSCQSIFLKYFVDTVPQGSIFRLKKSADIWQCTVLISKFIFICPFPQLK